MEVATSGLHVVTVGVYAALMLYAAYSDVRRLEIANGVSIAAGLLFLPAAWAADLPIVAVGIHAAVGLATLAVGIALFAKGLIGGADVKLLTAASIWIGLNDLPRFLVVLAIAGGVLAVFTLLERRANRVSRIGDSLVE